MIRRSRLQTPSETIQHQGFFLERGFLSPDDRARVMQVYDATAWDGNQNYRIKQVLDCSVFGRDLMRKVESLAQAVYPEEELMLHGAFFFVVDRNEPQRSIGFPFHQDSESFFVFQEHYHYLNLYLVVEKEDPANSNLTLVPFDVLEETDPTMYEVTRAAGGIDYRGRSFLDKQHGSTYRFGFDLEEIAVTPELQAGDALVMRGDLIHKTQNQLASRIAVSFRAIRKNAIVNRRKLLVPSPKKLAMVQKNLEVYAAIDYVFAQAGKDYLSVEELFAGLVELDKVRRHPPAALVWHALKFQARLLFLRATCRMW